MLRAGRVHAQLAALQFNTSVKIINEKRIEFIRSYEMRSAAIRYATGFDGSRLERVCIIIVGVSL